MPNTPGNFEVLARELGKALEPLQDLLGPDIFQRLGLGLPEAFRSRAPIANSFLQGQTIARELSPKIQALVDAIETGREGDMVQAGVSLLQTIIDLIQALVQLGQTLSNEAASFAFTPAEKAQLQAFGEQFASSLVNHLVVAYMENRVPTLLNSLMLLGLVDNEEVNSDPVQPLQIPYRKRHIHYDRIPRLFNQPDQHFLAVYEWGQAGFKGEKALKKIKLLLDNLNFPAELYQVGGKPALEAYLFHFQADDSQVPPGLQVELRIPAALEVAREFVFTPPWKAALTTKGTFGAGLQASLFPSGDLVVSPPETSLEFEVLLALKAEHADRKLLFIGTPGGSRLEAQALGGSAGAILRVNPAQGEAFSEPGITVFIREGKLVLDFSSSDGFLQNILSGVKVQSGFDLSGTWAPSTGLQLQGSASIEIALPVHVDLGVAEVNTVYLIGKFANDPPLEIELSTQLTANLGPLKAAIERMGVKVPLSFPADGQGNLGPLDLGFAFKPPNGVGLSLDAGVIKGGGYLYFDFDREEYAGALELVFSEWIALRAIGLITTRMPDGSKGFSLLLIITVEFGTGIQLGFGFTLLGVGGILGLNRSVNIDPLSEGVRTGAIESVMFPQNIIANAPRIISDLRRFFPPVADVFLIGPMAKIGWGTPTLVRVSLGIILEFPNITITILGVIKVTLPDENAVVLKLQVNFIGRIEPQNKLLWFYAELFDSRVLFLTLEGGMGLLVNWGDKPNFVISVGGFHPQYVPPPLPFPAPPRIAVNILNESFARVRIEGYFAVTSNSVQFGARVEVFFGLDEFKIEGHFSFDALFQFDPFYFSFSLSVSFSVKVFGVGLFSVGFSGLLEGPTRWHIKGRGHISILFFEISVPFEETWGESQDTELPPIAVFPLLEKEFNALTNWEAVLPAGSGLLVSLRKLGEDAADALVLHPVGYLRISQRKIPLDLVLEKVGSQKPGDVNKVRVSQSGGWQSLGTVQEPFAMGQFKDLDNAKKLSSPGFENQNSGLKVSAAGDLLRTSKAIKRTIRYETVVIDNNYKRHVIRFYQYFRAGYTTLYGTLFDHYLGGSAVSQSILSQSYRKQVQPFAEVIAVQPQQYSVAFTQNNQPLDATATHFNSHAEAQDFLHLQLQGDPNLAESLHVIPNTEMNLVV